MFCEPEEPLGAFTPANETLAKRSLMSEEDARLFDAMAELRRRI